MLHKIVFFSINHNRFLKCSWIKSAKYKYITIFTWDNLILKKKLLFIQNFNLTGYLEILFAKSCNPKLKPFWNTTFTSYFHIIIVLKSKLTFKVFRKFELYKSLSYLVFVVRWKLFLKYKYTYMSLTTYTKFHVLISRLF